MNQIAIIDDSEINLTLFRALVGRISGCESQTFQSSSKGLAWCVEHTPELIIVDYMMPEMDGLEFIRRLRGIPGRTDVPVLMITANIDKEVRYEALQNGATDFLNKPVDRIEFDARVRNMLALGESRRHLADRAAAAPPALAPRADRGQRAAGDRGRGAPPPDRTADRPQRRTGAPGERAHP